MRYLFIIALLSTLASWPAVEQYSEYSSSGECVAGVADGDVTFDGRPLLWKLRNEVDVTNDMHYFASGVEHYQGLGPATYSYLGMGPANDSPEGPVRQGLNSQGLAIGWNALGTSGWLQLHHQALGHYNTISQVRTYINGMTSLSTYNYFIDTDGQAALWENRTGTGQHWEYNTRAPARDGQWIDVDNADGDGIYSTCVDVSLSGWVVRANDPGHFNSDGTDDLGNAGRYKAGRDTIGALIYNNDYDTALSAKSLARNFFRHDTLAKHDTVSNMIVHGVLPTEDPRLSTMWTMLGHSETGVFVPVWIHGVESGGANRVPEYLDSGDDGVCVYEVVQGMYNAGFNEADVQARTLPFEEHLFDVVNNRLLPDWRNRDWTDSAVVTVIGEEMKRVQERMDADAFGHLVHLRDNGARSNYAPEVSIDSATHNDLVVTFSVTAHDADGGELTYLFDYGDSETGSSQTHEYAQAGHYLVSCTVTDENGVSQTDWLYVTVGFEPTCNDRIQNQGEDLIDCGGPCPACTCLLDGACDDGVFCNGPETCNAHGECQAGSNPCPGQLCSEGNDECYSLPPGAPSSLVASAVSRTQVKLTWRDNSCAESHFRIQRSPNGNTGWTTIATVGANVTSYQDTRLSCSELYYYRVRAYRQSDGQYSSYSNVANTPTQLCAPPSVASNLTATATSRTQIDLTWQDNSLDESDFHVERSTNGSTGWNMIGTVGANVTSYPDGGLSCGTRYDYRLRAHRHSDGQYSSYSDVASATTSSCPLYLPLILKNR